MTTDISLEDGMTVPKHVVSKKWKTFLTLIFYLWNTACSNKFTQMQYDVKIYLLNN